MVILLVEDDVSIRKFSGRLLEADGFTVLTACDGKAALESSRSFPGSIDLLLSKVELPRMSGTELCKIVAAERPGIKVLLMSGAAWGREHVSMNGLPFLQKPFSRKALRHSIEALFGTLPPLPRPQEPVETVNTS